MSYQEHQWYRLKNLPSGTTLYLEGMPVVVSRVPRLEDRTIVVSNKIRLFTIRDLSLLSTDLIVNKP